MLKFRLGFAGLCVFALLLAVVIQAGRTAGCEFCRHVGNDRDGRPVKVQGGGQGQAEAKVKVQEAETEVADVASSC